MPLSTSPDSIVYPVSTDAVAPLNAIFQDLADSTQSAIVSVRSVVLENAEQTDDYVLALADAGKVVVMNKTGTATLTVPANATVAFPLGTILYVYNISSGDVTVTPASGVTVRNSGTVAQYAQVLLRKRATNEWVMVA